MRIQAKVAQVNDFKQSLSTAGLNTLTQGLFKILTHTDIKEQDDDVQASINSEIQHLEDCANATRGTEAYDQYEWLNSDE